MRTLYGPIVRIALRYLSGILMAYGLIGSDEGDMLTNDPSLERDLVEIVQYASLALGAVIGIAVEFAYAQAKRWGWTT